VRWKTPAANTKQGTLVFEWFDVVGVSFLSLQPPGASIMVRKLKVTAKMERILRSQRKQFIKKFGREPGPDDPVFFDPKVDTPVSITPKQMEDATLKAMLAAGTPSQIVYAYQKTGFLVNETGYKNMSTEDRAEYDAAIDKYFAMEDAQEKEAKQ
jgi:hypothetical protein